VVATGRFRHRGDAVLLDEPPERHLRRRLPVSVADLGEGVVVEHRASRERAVRRQCHVVFSTDGAQFRLIGVRVIEDLVGDDRAVGDPNRVPELRGREVADAEVADPTSFAEFGHRGQRLLDGDARVWPVDQEQVQIVDAEIVEARLDGVDHVVVPEVRAPHLRGEKQLLPGNVGGVDRPSHGGLVLVHLCGVDVSVAEVQRGPDRVDTRLPLVLPGSEADLRDTCTVGVDVLHTGAVDDSEKTVPKNGATKALARSGRAMTDDPTGPLDGVTVLDASRVLAGPFCGMQLGDLGADVIKVERPDGGDQTRHWTPPAFGGEVASYYASINRNKRSITLNLASEEGRETFRDLAAEADVVLENFRVGKAADWDLDYETLRERNPGLVFCSITGYGQYGPKAERPAYDLMMQAEGGMMSITGEDGRPPVRVGVAVADLAAGMYATQSILAALFRREFAGEGGDRIDVALFDALLGWLSYMATDGFASGEAPERMGSRHPNIAPYQAFETADGYVVVACASQAIWYRLCQALDRPEIVDDPRFETNEKRVENRDELASILTDAFADDTVDEVVDLLRANDVPVGRIRDVLEAFDDPQAEARGMRQRVSHPTAGEIELPGSPMQFEDYTATARRHPPLLGEHTEAVLAELGYSEEVIERLQEDGAL